MITRQVAYKIFEIFALKENEHLTIDQQLDLVEEIVVDVYNKGRRAGHNKAVSICQDALKGLENSNSNLY